MALPAARAPAKGNHILFLLRNPNGITSVLSYLNTRSIKCWTATSLTDAQPKIKTHNIQMVFISISLKNVSVPAIIETLKRDFDIPIVIFSEETSRKIETDMAKLVTPNKIIPPNQNAKFLQMIQKNVGGSSGQAASAGGNVEDLLPPNSEPIEGSAVPENGRWLKINLDDKSVAPFTYKLIQPRSVTVGRTRYFYMGAKSPEMAKEGRGWVADGGEFYISGRIVEVAPEPEAPSISKPKTFQMTEAEAEGPLKPHWSTRSEKASDEEKSVQLTTRQHAGPGPIAQQSTATGLSRVSQSMKKQIDGLKSAVAEFSKFTPKMPSLGGLMDGLPDFAQVVDKVLGRNTPALTREPANMIERKLLKASYSAVERPLKDTELNEEQMVEKIGVAFIRTDLHTGFIICDLNDFSDENFATFERLVDALKTRYARDGHLMEVLLPPSIVPVEPLAFILQAKRNDHFLLHAENETQRLVCTFIEASGVFVPEPSPEHEKLEIPAEALNPDQKLLFNLYLHMPKNEKQLQYFRIGHLVPAATIQKLMESPGTEILIDPASVASYFGYTAVNALVKQKTPEESKRKVQ